ncbi:hypothetical protein CEP51_014893 [Fusarium floridanum]|uniref:Uncharacterized protein n=1 Tax=Fusarium floridanum TaxID=1325733 RepID=A0A428PK50_9HYPO|nr:hypothetical protein CEP51_014893 [Fusarium floridanum]
MEQVNSELGHFLCGSALCHLHPTTIADRDEKPAAQESTSESPQASAQAPPDPPASRPTVLADGALQMMRVEDGRGLVVTAGFVNTQGGCNFNVVAPASDIYPGAFVFQGGIEAVMAAMEAARVYQEEPQQAAQPSPNADPDGSQAIGQSEQSCEAADERTNEAIGTPSTEEPRRLRS